MATQPSDNVDNFLDSIGQVESGGGENFNHKPITSGMHKGHRAIGTYGLMPNTVDEVIQRSKGSTNYDPNMDKVLEMDPVEKKQFLETNPDVEKKIARTLASYVLKRQGGDEEKAAYAWNQGHNLSPDKIASMGYRDSDYVKKFNDANDTDGYVDEDKSSRSPQSSGPKFEDTKELPQANVPKFEDTKELPASDSKYSELESAGRGAMQGASLGFADEATGAVKAGIGALQGEKPSLKELYQQYRDIERKKNEDAQAQNPKSYMAGNIGGGVATTLIPGLNIAKGATLANAAIKAGAIGAATGLGSSDADLTKGDVGGAAIDTAVGGALGAGAGAIGQKIGQALTPEATQARASMQAIKALGGKAIPDNAPIGQAVLNQGALPFMSGAAGTEKAITGGINDIEQNSVQPLLKSVSENSGLSKAVGGRKPIEDIVSSVADEAKASIPKSSVKESLSNSIDKLSDYWTNELKQAKGDPSKLNELRKLIDKEARAAGAFTENPILKPKADFLNNLRDAVNDELRGISSDVSSGAGADLASNMQQQSNLIKAQGMAGKLVDKDALNPPGDIGAMIKSPVSIGKAAITGAGVLNPVGTAGVLAGKIGLEKATGNPVGRLANIASARGQNYLANTAMGQGILNTGQGITSATAKALPTSGVQTGIQSIYTTSHPQLKQIADKFIQDPKTQVLGKSLGDAIDNKDEDAKNKIIFALEQRPDTRAQMREMLDNQRDEDESDRSMGFSPNSLKGASDE
jgi:hypothetical protein